MRREPWPGRCLTVGGPRSAAPGAAGRRLGGIAFEVLGLAAGHLSDDAGGPRITELPQAGKRLDLPLCLLRGRAEGSLRGQVVSSVPRKRTDRPDARPMISRASANDRARGPVSS